MRQRKKKDTFYNPESLTDVELAYLAGLLDGEGSFQIRLHRRKGRMFKYYPRVVIKMNAGNWESIVLKSGVGRLYSRQGKYKDQSAWYIYRFNEIESFLKTILPHLRVKRRHADLILEWIELGDNTKPASNMRLLSRKRSLPQR